MDALKKAELAKRQGHAEGIAATEIAGSAETNGGGIALEPLNPAADNPSVAPDITQSAAPPHEPPAGSPLRLEALDDEFLAEIKKTSRRPPAASAGSSVTLQEPRKPAPAQRDSLPKQTAANNLFAAKQPPAATQKKSFALVLGSSTALAIVAISVYFWWQLQPRQANTSLAMNPATVPEADFSETGSKLRGVSPAPTILPPAATPITTLPPANILANAESDKAEVTQPVQSTGRSSKEFKLPATDPAADHSIVRLTKTPLRVDPSLMRGYDAFNRGDLASAQSEYTRALQTDPGNTDAMHGLAATALRQGHLERAATGYQKILEANPQDPLALAALINIRSQIDPAAAESRLKTLAVAQPDIAAPDFALGNLYAKQARWNEAQQAYFRAYNTEPENPDILYNLAISLEHLRQTRLAAQYYAQALAAAQTRPAGFDQAQATTRLHALQP